MNGHQKQRQASKQMIETALFALMEEMDFSQITVCQIAERADVARRTFYRLYRSKEDVMYQYFAGLCDAYQDSCQELAFYDLRRIAEDYFGFWHQHKEQLLLLHRCGMDRMLYYEMSRVSMQIVRMRIGDKALKERPDFVKRPNLAERSDLARSSDLEKQMDCKELPGLAYFADYSVGGFVNLLHRWVQSEMQETPGEYARKCSDAILQFSAMNAH